MLTDTLNKALFFSDISKASADLLQNMQFIPLIHMQKHVFYWIIKSLTYTYDHSVGVGLSHRLHKVIKLRSQLILIYMNFTKLCIIA
jgi:hypothetical protein